MLQFRTSLRSLARVSDGRRLYAVGDIHGRFDLVARLVAQICNDNAARARAQTCLIFLGDYIDRGPQAAEVCSLLHKMRGTSQFVCLKGNHEDVMIKALDGDRAALRLWFRIGGIETMRSFAVNDTLIQKAIRNQAFEAELIAAIRAGVTEPIIAWINALPTFHRVDDFLFVHADVKPGVDLSDQNDADRLWIREPFLRSRTWHGALIVHGHSAGESVDKCKNRIGIDTAAYRSGHLTAIGLENSDHWFLST